VFRLTNPLLAVAFVGCGRLNFDATPGINSTDSASDTGASLAVTSCLQIAPTCGGAKDCCENNVVPGGTFLRSYDLAGDGMYSATVQAFRFDTFEVTVGRFRAFVRAGKGTQSAPPSIGDGANPYVSNSGWTQAMTSRLPATTPLLIAKLKCGANAMWTDAAGANENRAVNCVSWHESMAFCAWDGGFVPTEAEWNFAAAGGDEQRAYPWSSPPASLAIDTTMASYNAEMTFFDVGSKPAGNARWGQADLAGGLWSGQGIEGSFRIRQLHALTAQPSPVAPIGRCVGAVSTTISPTCEREREVATTKSIPASDSKILVCVAHDQSNTNASRRPGAVVAEVENKPRLGSFPDDPRVCCEGEIRL
jgi:hypothetical protein